MEEIIGNFYPYAQKKLNFNKPVRVNMISDPNNAKDPFGKTAYYDPNKMEITIFVDKRHAKDILRSFSHELVHHAQNCRGEFDKGINAEEGYAQKDPHMRKMEAEAYLLGNGFLVRDYEDAQKKEKHQMTEQDIRDFIQEVLKEEEIEEENVEESVDSEALEETDEVEEAKMPMKKDTEDDDDDGGTEEEVPAFLKEENLSESVGNNFNSSKNKLLNEALMKRWCK